MAPAMSPSDSRCWASKIFSRAVDRISPVMEPPEVRLPEARATSKPAAPATTTMATVHTAALRQRRRRTAAGSSPESGAAARPGRSITTTTVAMPAPASSGRIHTRLVIPEPDGV